MKLCRYAKPGQDPAIGIVLDGTVYDLGAILQNEKVSFAQLLNRPNLYRNLSESAKQLRVHDGVGFESLDVAPSTQQAHLLAPLTDQEVWAAGVTYLRSRDARMEESEGGGSFYDKVYVAERPELFFKATAHRVSGTNAPVRIRAVSRWNVPEPELALVLSADGRLVGFTIGNDMSSRDIEGENPLYLPQAKVYRGCCSLGPAILLSESVPDPRALSINLNIRRSGNLVFGASTSISRMKRSLEELIAYLFREQEFPNGVVLLTGTGIVPPDDFTLLHGDLVEISIPEIGTLRNRVE